MTKALTLGMAMAGLAMASILSGVTVAAGQATSMAPAATDTKQVDAGRALFLENCGYCHGRDAAGGESGPDLTRSKLVGADVGGDQIGPVIRNGRVEHGMPRFSFSDEQISSLVAFIHYAKQVAESQNGNRRGVDAADLQTGNAEQGRAYFYGDGKCSTCHSPTGDLAGVATRHQGLELEMRMLYPRRVKSKITVKLPSGQTMTGELAYRDEFTVGLRDADGRYHSWPTSNVKFTIDAPVNAHAALLAKYTDADIHNLMAYLQTLH